MSPPVRSRNNTLGTNRNSNHTHPQTTLNTQKKDPQMTKILGWLIAAPIIAAGLAALAIHQTLTQITQLHKHAETGQHPK